MSSAHADQLNSSLILQKQQHNKPIAIPHKSIQQKFIYSNLPEDREKFLTTFDKLSR